mmetsp:Transcript_67933/g.189726  ORF Transcript_67933/g.189726 Transcript_67933/m.189726 type:complete len:222 (-) Transcript_67933:1369-2034(-)
MTCWAPSGPMQFPNRLKHVTCSSARCSACNNRPTASSLRPFFEKLTTARTWRKDLKPHSSRAFCKLWWNQRQNTCMPSSVSGGSSSLIVIFNSHAPLSPRLSSQAPCFDNRSNRVVLHWFSCLVTPLRSPPPRRPPRESRASVHASGRSSGSAGAPQALGVERHLEVNGSRCGPRGCSNCGPSSSCSTSASAALHPVPTALRQGSADEPLAGGAADIGHSC